MQEYSGYRWVIHEEPAANGEDTMSSDQVVQEERGR